MKTTSRKAAARDKVYIEIGFDRDNNRWGLGRSVEIEHPDGSEERRKLPYRLVQVESHYLRLWIGTKVLVWDGRRPHCSISRKTRRNFKLVYGRWGYAEGLRSTSELTPRRQGE